MTPQSGRIEVDALSLIHSIPGPDGKNLVLDFSTLGFDKVVAGAFRRALIGVAGHTTASNQVHVFRTLKALHKCLSESGLGASIPLPSNTARLFREWLVLHRAGSSARQAMNIVTNLLAWCQRNASEAVDRKLSLLVPAIPVSAPKPRLILDTSTIKNVLTACYGEIESSLTALERGRRLLAGECSEDERKEADVLRLLVQVGDGELPNNDVLRTQERNEFVAAILSGGRRATNRMLWPAAETLLPFYLVILIQTSGNPDSILRMSRDCIALHPIRADLERVIWVKIRSGREQRVDFPMNRESSAPALIRRLLAITTKVADRCSEGHRSLLFICRASHGEFGPPTMSRLHQLLDEFIVRHSLPNFGFRDLRRAGAVAHHLAAGTIDAARIRLNHRSTKTTAIYTALADRASEHDQVIRRFQGELIRKSTEALNSSAKVGCESERVRPDAAETVFGFKCKDPFGGIAPGSRAGSLCMQFAGCATCPGALIPLDDPQVVRKLLSAATALEEARIRSLSEGWWSRYAALYEGTRKILENELLPALDPAVRLAAISLDERPLIPRLE